MLSDIEIAQAAKMQPITEIAANLGLQGEDVIPYGHYKAKLNHKLAKADKPEGKLILVTAISPTPAGEGKTTTSVGLADAMNALGKKTMLCLREPSLGPVFGIKGGAAGGGYAQVVPMEDINLHFTGDIHAIGAANNLLAAMIDNSIQQGNPLNIDPRRITWKRCMDMNDRQLRFIVDGLGGKVNGTPREDGFDITAASEIMAVLCLATSIADLKERLSRIIVGYTYDEQPVTFAQSWRQRMRWAKGFYQVNAHCGASLARGCLRGPRRFSCYDMLMTIAPCVLLTIAAVFVNLFCGVTILSLPPFLADFMLRHVGRSLLTMLLWSYGMMFVYGLLTVLAEWRRIPASPLKKVMYLPFFPLFMLTYIPISLAALLVRVEWKPIRHTSIEDVRA